MDALKHQPIKVYFKHKCHNKFFKCILSVYIQRRKKKNTQIVE